MCIRDRRRGTAYGVGVDGLVGPSTDLGGAIDSTSGFDPSAVSYTHLRAHETVLDLVCRLLLEKKNQPKQDTQLHTEHTYMSVTRNTQLIHHQQHKTHTIS